MLFISPGFTPQTGLSSTTETHGGSEPALGAVTPAWGSRSLPWATPLPVAGQWGLSGGPGHCWTRLGQAEMLNTQRRHTDPAPLAQDRLIPKG